jgi:hypothetical protein
MTQLVNITLNSPLNPNLGPTFFITANVGTVSPSVLTATQLLAGYDVTANTLATQIIIIPAFGSCQTPITLTIA